ncbi:hypothetical protein U1839_26410 [Sphingomonas sp. RT2P30]|uniref:hypothetical protein n=1 Tax=Parasphingomonas halimpatiens TaxID=3096162 RepID=UPI002FC80944
MSALATPAAHGSGLPIGGRPHLSACRLDLFSNSARRQFDALSIGKREDCLLRVITRLSNFARRELTLLEQCFDIKFNILMRNFRGLLYGPLPRP